MMDDVQRLRQSTILTRLLEAYAALGAENREAWHDRIMDFPEVDTPGLVQLHGELLAFGWIEQNTGVLPCLEAGRLPQCYRTTTAGVRALKRAAMPSDNEEEATAQAA